MKYYTRTFLCLSMCLLGLVSKSQDTIVWTGYLESYYLYDFNTPGNHTRPSFTYSHNKHNQLAVNLALLKMSASDSNWRSNLGFMAGTYPEANLTQEPLVYRFLYEANAGVRLSNRHELWLDAGLFPSHIGCESAIGKDCWNLTRSLAADNSPYFETGVKLSYTSKNNKWSFSGMYLNGWQRINPVDGNSLPSFGTQINFKPSEKLLVSGNSFIGSDKPDIMRQMRYFHNL